MNIEKAILKPLLPYNKYEHSGCWHQGYKFSINNVYLRIAGMIVGCRIAQMAGNIDLCEDKTITKEMLLEKLQPLVVDGVGAVVAVFGDEYKCYHDRMIELGFEPLKTYNNYRHCRHGTYKQTLYILTL